MNSPMNKEFAEIEKLQNIDKVVMDKNKRICRTKTMLLGKMYKI